MHNNHSYEIQVVWQGNRGSGTSGYRDYSRAHEVSAPGLQPIAGSADKTFHGDRERWNPEQLLLAALTQCHMLSYLHQAVQRGVVVVEYTDNSLGTMVTSGMGGAFTEAVLRPRVVVAHEDMREAALEAHAEASKNCFIAQSVAFPVRHEPVIEVAA
ncbi:OsmC family protein [Humidisolicoccus flavus]|uniref:OsmC family protein n=1 Tax=Humidisolicoccus flavus TaxID=3111414 RepID=UPI00324EFAB4